MEYWKVNYLSIHGDACETILQVPKGTSSFKIRGLAKSEIPMCETVTKWKKMTDEEVEEWGGDWDVERKHLSKEEFEELVGLIEAHDITECFGVRDTVRLDQLCGKATDTEYLEAQKKAYS